MSSILDTADPNQEFKACFHLYRDTISKKMYIINLSNPKLLKAKLALTYLELNDNKHPLKHRWFIFFFEYVRESESEKIIRVYIRDLCGVDNIFLCGIVGKYHNRTVRWWRLRRI
jgi:hypothetical protein